MAEAFIEEIYKDALIIEYLREYLVENCGARDREARELYNAAAEGMERILPAWGSENPAAAGALMDNAVLVQEVFGEDVCLANGIVRGKLLPLMFEYMSAFTGIDTEAGKYRLKSADSGFLSIMDKEQGKYLHDTHDPMWEAYRQAEQLYRPEMAVFYILGCGLGYLPYQIWARSEGSAKIIVYEEDEQLLELAQHYGVLSWIPEVDLEIVSCEGEERLAKNFLAAAEAGKGNAYGYEVMPWKYKKYSAACGGNLVAVAENQRFNRSMSDRSAMNLRKNLEKKARPFEELKKKYENDEWIILSAGPSFDGALSFVRENAGKKGIIGVNTVLKRLVRDDIHVDLLAVADQHPFVAKHIEGAEEATSNITLIADYLANWQYVEKYRGPVCFVRTSASDSSTEGIAANEEVWQVSGTVASLAVEAAIHLGARKIYLVGQDLAYPGGKTYAKDMPYEAERNRNIDMQVPSVDGGTVPTSRVFYWFLRALEQKIAQYPGIEFYNLSEHGAFIRGAAPLQF